jgi:hypothetical protein
MVHWAQFSGRDGGGTAGAFAGSCGGSIAATGYRTHGWLLCDCGCRLLCIQAMQVLVPTKNLCTL